MAYTYDIIVAGGGVAGCAAALAARREGKRVLLIEKSLTLGGLGTLGLINLFVPMDNGRGKLIIKGMCQEFVKLSRKYGWSHVSPAWEKGEPSNATDERYICRYSPNIFALALLEQLVQEGVEILLDSVVSGCEAGGGSIGAVRVTNKSGDVVYPARMFIDATGDADLCARAGAPVVQGQNYFTYVAYEASLSSCQKASQEGDIGLLTRHIHGGNATLYGENQPAHMKKFLGTTCEDVTEYVIRNQLELLSRLKWQTPTSRDIVTLPGMAQFRTTRHIAGADTLKTTDVFRHRDDSVCLICDFDHRDDLYEVPLGCLVCGEMDNLFAVGRAASAEGYAWDILRVIPPAILTGQAAGIAAAHAIDEGARAPEVDVRRLQTSLLKANVLLHYTDDLLPEGACAGEKAGAEGHL